MMEALVLVVIWLVIWLYLTASDLKLLRNEIRPLFSALESLRARLRELQDRVHAPEGGTGPATARAPSPTPILPT